jgi:hypothetical protein
MTDLAPVRRHAQKREREALRERDDLFQLWRHWRPNSCGR